MPPLIGAGLSYGAAFLPGPPVGGPPATWDPLKTSSNFTLSNGDLTVTVNTSSGWDSCVATKGFNTGKVVWEITMGMAVSNFGVFGVCSSDPVVTTDLIFANFAKPGEYSGVYKSDNGNFYVDDATQSSGNPTIGITDTIMCAMDLDSGTNTLKLYRSDSLLFTGTLPSGRDWYPGISMSQSVGDFMTANFGASGFVNSIPSGYVSVDVGTGI